MPILTLSDLTIGYDQGKRPSRVVASGLNASLNGGELVCLLGPNGAGKSTLMRTIAGMQPPLNGRIQLNGRGIGDYGARELARELSIVLTERVSTGTMTAYGLVALGRHPYTDWRGQLSVRDEEVVGWALRMVGAVGLAQRDVNELSDGERQKIMIARALAQEPALMVLDEPTAFLDLPRRVEVMAILRQLARDQNRAILLSTHDLDLALRSADRLWLLPDEGPMRVGAPEDLVLSGAFAETFRSEGVVFDAYTGSFQIHRQQRGVIGLAGEGLTAVWATRALEREGFCVDGDSSLPVQVRVVGVDGRVRWTLTRSQQTQSGETIAALLAALKGE